MAEKGPQTAFERVQAHFGDTVSAKPLHEPETASEGEVEEILTRLCYFYPQYNLEDAEKLADSQVTALLMQAEKQRAIELYNHTLIAAAPHTKKGQLVNKLIKQYKKISEL